MSVTEQLREPHSIERSPDTTHLREAEAKMSVITAEERAVIDDYRDALLMWERVRAELSAALSRQGTMA